MGGRTLDQFRSLRRTKAKSALAARQSRKDDENRKSSNPAAATHPYDKED